MIQSLLRQILISDVGVSELVDTRVYDMVLPRDISFPCIQLHRVSETIDRWTNARRTRFQIDCYGETHPSSIILSELVNKALIDIKDKSGNMIVYTMSQQNTYDNSDIENRVYRITLDYAIIWRYINND